MNRAIKYAAYPTEEQKTLFSKTFGCCRKIWNLMFADIQAAYKATGKKPAVTPAQYKSQYPYLREVDSLALCGKWLDLQEAFHRFFAGTAKYPKFKSKHKCRDSYTTNFQKSGAGGTIRIDVGKQAIRLPKVGFVKIKLHRLPHDNWNIKSATVSRDSDGRYYISVLFEYEESHPQVTLPKEKDSINAIGLDYKSDGLYMDSNGSVCGSTKSYRKAQAKIAKQQRVLSRRQKGSSNYGKAKTKLARIHKHAANQRKDYLHKVSKRLADTYDVVCVESLNMKSMANHKFHNGKATMDNGYGEFLSMLRYKLEAQGKYLVEIDKWYPSSQICHACGSRRKLKLSERTYVCPVCGTVIDRDYNAAMNILDEGLRTLLTV